MHIVNQREFLKKHYHIFDLINIETPDNSDELYVRLYALSAQTLVPPQLSTPLHPPLPGLAGLCGGHSRGGGSQHHNISFRILANKYFMAKSLLLFSH